ncbi:MAG: thioredoxin [Candidatus Paceibacterota bacterium]|jgi:thioredoxin 1
MEEITLTKDNFEEQVLKADLPVLVDFWATWCGPCQMQNPILEELAKEMDGKLVIGKVNVDANQELAGSYGVMSIPTLKLFHKGQVAGEWIGVQSKDKLIEEVNKLN